MTDTEEARELTIEEQTHAVLANALDQLSNETPGGKVRWATTTLPAMLNLVIVDLDRHLRKPTPPMPRLERPEPTAEAIRRHEVRQREEQRYRSTAKELGEAFRKENR